MCLCVHGLSNQSRERERESEVQPWGEEFREKGKKKQRERKENDQIN